jgi:hypothetical protein
MAKDLPYFKFFCSEWNDGDITLEDYKIQGVFINVCSYYWSRECNLESKMLYKRFKDVKEEIDLLVSENHIKALNGNIVISFLDEQKEDRDKRSVIRSKGGKASAEARRLKKIEQTVNKDSTQIQHVLRSSSTQVQVLREEKRREENINNKSYLNIVLKDSSYIEITSMQTKSNPDTVIKYLKDFEAHLIRTSEQKQTLKDFKSHFTNWLNKQDIKKIVKIKKIDYGNPNG